MDKLIQIRKAQGIMTRQAFSFHIKFYKNVLQEIYHS